MKKRKILSVLPCLLLVASCGTTSTGLGAGGNPITYAAAKEAVQGAAENLVNLKSAQVSLTIDAKEEITRGTVSEDLLTYTVSSNVGTVNVEGLSLSAKISGFDSTDVLSTDLELSLGFDKLEVVLTVPATSYASESSFNLSLGKNTIAIYLVDGTVYIDLPLELLKTIANDIAGASISEDVLSSFTKISINLNKLAKEMGFTIPKVGFTVDNIKSGLSSLFAKLEDGSLPIDVTNLPSFIKLLENAKGEVTIGASLTKDDLVNYVVEQVTKKNSEVTSEEAKTGVLQELSAIESLDAETYLIVNKTDKLFTELSTSVEAKVHMTNSDLSATGVSSKVSEKLTLEYKDVKVAGPASTDDYFDITTCVPMLIQLAGEALSGLLGGGGSYSSSYILF